MIPELSAFQVSVRRHRAAHAQLHALCALVYSAREELGNEGIQSQDWRAFIERVWQFHNRAMISVLPLNDPALLSTADADLIATNAQSLRTRKPHLANLATKIADAVRACRLSTITPLGDVVRKLLRDTPLVLLALDDHDFTAATRVALSTSTATPIEVLSESDQRQNRERIRCGVDAIVLGKLGRLDRAFFRAPLANTAFTVVQYEWVNDLFGSDLAGPSLFELTQQSTPSHVVVNDSIEKASTVSTSLAERLPFERPDPWQIFATDETVRGKDAELVTSLMLVLAGVSRELLATLLNADGRVDIIRVDASGPHALDALVPEVSPGDLYVRHDDPADQDKIAELAQRLLKTQGLDERTAADQRQWKHLLRERIRSTDIQSVRNEVAELCSTWKPGIDNLEHWSRDDTIGPQRKESFRAVCHVLGISEDRAAEYWKMMKELHNARIAAGKQLNEQMLQHVVDACHKDEIPYRHATRRAVAGRATTVFPVELIATRTRDVPRGWLHREPVALSQLDLEELLQG